MIVKGTKQSKDWIRKRVETRKARGNYHMNEITRLKISESQKGRIAWNKGLTKYDSDGMYKLSIVMLNSDFKLLHDKKWLSKKYIDEYFTIKQIAEIIGCCPTTVANYLKMLNIPIRSDREAQLTKKKSIIKLNDRDFLYQKYEIEGKSCQKIGNEIECSPQAISRALKRFDIKIRDLSESHKGQPSGFKGKHFSDESRRKWFKSNNFSPNKQEIKLQNILNEVLPNEYLYVGDGDFILGGRCPDYLNINGQKKLIELYGDFWHKGEDGIERVEYFKSFGFETLIVREHELKNMDILSQKIQLFNDFKNHISINK